MKVTAIESGYDYITFYFKDPIEMNSAGEALYRAMKLLSFPHFPLQRKNMRHLPGDVPHFHLGIPAEKGPHFHILFPHRPTEGDWLELVLLCRSRRVGIEIPEAVLKDRQEIC